MRPGAITVARHHLRFVYRDPAGDPVAERLGDDRRVLREPLRRAADRPAAFVLEGLRQIPVIERGGGGDAASGKLVQQCPVVVEPALVDRSPAVRLDPRPGDREPVGAEAERGHQPGVFGVPMVGVASDVAGVPAADLAGRVAEGVPHGWALAVGVGRSFDLIGGRRRAPGEAVREGQGTVGAGHGCRHRPS